MKIEELETIVVALNEELHKKKIDDYIQYELSTNGLQYLISLGTTLIIWDSDNDERKFNEKTNEYESLEKFIKKETQKAIKKLMTIFKSKEKE